MFRFCFVAALLAAYGTAHDARAAAGRSAPGQVHLFLTAEADPAVLGEPEEWELGRHLVSLNWRALARLCDQATADLPQALEIALKPELSVVSEALSIRRSEARPNTLQWKGTVRGHPDGRVTWSAVGLCGPEPERTALAGSVRFDGQEYAVQPRSKARAVVVEIDPMAMVAGLNPTADGFNRRVRRASGR